MIHLRPVPRKYSFAADANYVETHAKLKAELSHQSQADIWAQMERHERRVKERAEYLQQGGS